MRSRSGPRKRTRLPPWTWLVCLLGGAVTYCAVGGFLQGERFMPDLQGLFEDPGSLVNDDVAQIAPFVLLLIPAVLGALATRAMLRIVFDGVRNGDAPAIIFKNILLYLASALALVIAAFFFGNGRVRR